MTENKIQSPLNLRISINKNLIAEMPLVTFPGTITVADTPEKADMAVEALSKERTVGFDTETKPSFKKERPTRWH